MSLHTSFRALRRERAFTAAVCLTLAIWSWRCLAIFTVVKGVLFAPLPYLEAERLALVWMTNPQQGIDRDVVSYPSRSKAVAHVSVLDWLSRSWRLP